MSHLRETRLTRHSHAPVLIVLLFSILAHPSAAASDTRTIAQVISVYDGDTFKAEAMIWPGLIWKGNIRVEGVDTPEIRGKCDQERSLAIQARDFVIEKIGKTVVLENVKHGKYAGRVVAAVLLEDGSNLANILIDAGLGRAYNGGKRPSWCSPTDSGY